MPTIDIPRKIADCVLSPAMYKIIYGGRGSAKSGSVGRIMLMKCQTERADILCGREYQNSISESVHKLLKSLINNQEYGISGFEVTDTRIKDLIGGGEFAFKGFARNPENTKSAEDYKYSWAEEAQTMSQTTLDILLPTIRADGSQLYFTLNPGSSSDPISKRFIVPYKDIVDSNGFYEDDMHYIVKVNWRDNPFWNAELEAKRAWDFEHLVRAKYDWIWEGEFNDSVESPLILAEWFDACIDAHKKLGFEPRGQKFATHDPSDTGPDPKAYALRHGPVLVDLKERETGDVNEGCDWATGLAINHNADAFSWDVGGMGTSLKRQVAYAFDGKKITVSQFDGSRGVDNPENIFDPVSLDVAIQDQKKVKDCVKNRRAQYYLDLRQAVYRTYEAVVHGKYHDPDTMFSIDSKIDIIPKLRSELCRMPVKPNSSGLFEMYTKQELKSKFKFESPNLADCVMMSRRVPKINIIQNFIMPKPIRPMGRRK